VTVGLAIVARDEADNLPGLLDSVQGAFDQVVLCDTGSTDGTVGVFEDWARGQDWAAHGFAPWKVGRFAWRDDFAAARNHADSLLDTAWSSWADCDDVVTGAGRLRELARAAPLEVGGFMAGYDYGRLSDGTTISYLRRERLVRRAQARGWVNRVHESQRFDGAAVTVGSEVCEWVHRKWTLRLDEPPPAPERNLRILRRWVAEEPGHAFALSCLALELRARGEHREAVRWFRRYLAASPREDWPEYRAQMLRKLATSHLILGEPRTAIRLARAAIDLVPSWPDSYLTLAEANLARQRWRRAERWAREALRRGPPDTDLTVSPLDYTFGPRLMLAGALAGMGRFDEAIATGEEARELVPGHAQLERQLAAWRRRELAGRAPGGRRAPRAAAAAAAAAMVAALLGPALDAGAAPTPAGPHNELGAVTWTGVPILPPSTTGFARRPFGAVGGGHQLRGSQYVPFVSVFDATTRSLGGSVVGGFGRTNSDVTAIFPFDSTTFLGIDQTTTGRIGAMTQFGQTDPECRSAFGPQRPVSFDRGYLSPFLAAGALPPTDTGFFLDLFNPSTCHAIAATSGAFDPSLATDVHTFLFGPGGVLVAGGLGVGPDEQAVARFLRRDALLSTWLADHPLVLPPEATRFELPGFFTGGVSVGATGFDLVGADPNRALFFGACGGPTGQPDPRCGPGGTRVLLDLDPRVFQTYNPQIATFQGVTVISLPYQNLQDGTAHARFLRVDPTTLAVQSERDVLFSGTTRIPGLAIDPRTRNVLFGVTTRNPLDPNNSLDNNRVGLGLLNPDLSLNRLTINQSAPRPPTFAPAPDSAVRPIDALLLEAFVGLGGGRAQAQAAAVNPRRIVRVQVGVVKLGGTRARPTCAWLRDRAGHLVADVPIRGSCQGARWVTARRGRGASWSLRLAHGLPRGRYFAYSRATNAAGVTERSFSATDGNRRPFTVR
jgi:tetratricopeptide (TPR) repeat protein